MDRSKNYTTKPNVLQEELLELCLTNRGRFLFPSLQKGFLNI